MRTDHRPLSFVKAGSEHNRKLARWWAEILSFDIVVEYIKGKNNAVPDALSRLTCAVEDVDVNDFLGFNYSVVSGGFVGNVVGVGCAHC